MKSDKLYKIISDIMNIPESQITDMSGPKSIPSWDSFNAYVLLNEIEIEFNVQFTLDESLDIHTVGDFKRHLKNHGIDINNE